MDLSSLRNNAGLAPVQTAQNAPVQAPAAAPASVIPGFTSLASFDALQRMAKLFAASSLVPAQFQGTNGEAVANTAIALDMAIRMKANPLMVLQNLYIVGRRPAWSSQFLIATFNQSGKYSSIRFEFEGEEGKDSYGCRACATELATGEKLSGALVTIGMAKKEGWFGKNGSKWQTMPELMLRYRAAAFFIRAVAPEIAMGLRTAEEERDIIDVQPVRSPYHPAPAAVHALEEAQEAPVQAHKRTRKTRVKAAPVEAQESPVEAPSEPAVEDAAALGSEPAPVEAEECPEGETYDFLLAVQECEDVAGAADCCGKACAQAGISSADLIGYSIHTLGLKPDTPRHVILCGLWQTGRLDAAIKAIKAAPGGTFRQYMPEEDF